MGDKVVTNGKIINFTYIEKDAELCVEPVIWIGHFKVNHLNTNSRPVCIEKDALDPNYPFQDLYVSPEHSLLLNGKIVIAGRLINGKRIYQDRQCDSVEYYHLECKDHYAIYANGVLTETYYDAMNRGVFI